MEHMCWMNLGKAAPLLYCLRKITFTTSVWDWHGLFISISSKLNNMKYEHQVQDDSTAFMVQHTAPGFGKGPCWSQTRALKHIADPSPNIQTSAGRTEGSMWQQVSRTMHTCTPGGQTAHSSPPALLACGRSPGGCQAQELAVLLVQSSARTI